MIAISASEIKKEYGDRVVLQSVSFSVNKGEKVGFIGINGAGKTTLFNILSGKDTPDSGNFFIEKNSNLGLLQQFSVNRDNTVREEVLSGFAPLIEEEKYLSELSSRIENGECSLADEFARREHRFAMQGGGEYRSRAEGAIKGLGLYEYADSPVSNLSGGQATLLGLCRLLLSDSDILLLDEPTNHLDSSAITWLENFISHSEKTILTISHDRYFLDRTADKIILIEDGKAKSYKGNYSDYKNKHAKEKEIQAHHYESEQKELKRQLEYIEAQRRINRQRNIIAAESREKMLAKKSYTEKPRDKDRVIKPQFTFAGSLTNDVLTVKNLKMGFDKSGVLFKELSFDVKKGERVFILGPNGCGKSTLLKILANRMRANSGYSMIAPSITTNYIDQDVYSIAPLGDDVFSSLRESKPQMTDYEIRSLLAAFNFRGEDVFKKNEVLSGGERARLYMAAATLVPCDLLFLDEPTNHLDIASREALEDALESFEGTVIAVSHDRYFIKKLATRILYFSGTETVNEFDGSFEEYEKELQDNSKSTKLFNKNSNSSPQETTSAKEKFIREKEEKNRRRNEKARVKRAKEEIAKIENRLEEIETEEKVSQTDYEKLSLLSKEKEDLEEKLLILYEETM